MASVSKIFKPRRGLASTMAGSGKKNIVLQKGEFFLEAPSGGMGTGASKVKVGDGTTAYSSLPYALGDTSNDKIDFSNNTSTTVANALTSVASGKALKTIIGGLKQAISLCNTSITKLNDDTSKIKTYVGTDGLLHFVDKAGADTVLNFNKGTELKLKQIYCGNVLNGGTVSYKFIETWNHALFSGVVGSSGTGNEFYFSCSCTNIFLASSRFDYPPSGEFKTYLLTNVTIGTTVSLRGYTGNQSIITIYGID